MRHYFQAAGKDIISQKHQTRNVVNVLLEVPTTAHIQRVTVNIRNTD